MRRHIWLELLVFSTTTFSSRTKSPSLRPFLAYPQVTLCPSLRVFIILFFCRLQRKIAKCFNTVSAVQYVTVYCNMCCVLG